MDYLGKSGKDPNQILTSAAGSRGRARQAQLVTGSGPARDEKETLARMHVNLVNLCKWCYIVYIIYIYIYIYYKYIYIIYIYYYIYVYIYIYIVPYIYIYYYYYIYNIYIYTYTPNVNILLVICVEYELNIGYNPCWSAPWRGKPPNSSMIFPAQWPPFNTRKTFTSCCRDFLAVQCAPRAQISASLPIVWLGHQLSLLIVLDSQTCWLLTLANDLAVAGQIW